MSMNPNDPFANPNANHGRAQPTYGQDDFAPARPRNSNSKLWLGCGLASLLGLLVCCGGFAALSYFGMDMMGDLMRAEVEDSPTVIEHFGQLESMRFNISATAEEAQNIQPGQGSPMVFDVQGTKGSGQIVVQQSRSAQGVESAVLITSDGQRFPIELLGNSEAELDDIEVQLNDLIETGSAEE